MKKNMSAQKFSKKEAIKFGWQITKTNFWFFAKILLIAFLISFVNNIANEDLTKKEIEILPPLVDFILILIFGILQIIISMGLIKISLRFCDNKKATFSELFSCSHLFFKYLVGSIFYILIILGGMILLIIPGIIWAIKFSFFPYFIIDKNLGPIAALKKSAEITKDAKWNLFLFGLLVGGLNLAGFLALVIGYLFVTLPISMVANAFIFRKLSVPTEITQNPYQKPQTIQQPEQPR